MPTDGDFYRFDDVTIDCENFRVRKGGQNINLTPRAFDVLLFLAKNGGRVIEKQEIFDQVWKETFVSDNALTKIIKEIRHALDDAPNHPRYIETLPKRGYRLIAALSEPSVLIEASNAWEPLDCQPESKIEQQAPATWTQNYSNRFVLFTGLIVVGLGVLSLYFLTGGKASNKQITGEPIDSIAVLPFENAAQDPNAEYLSDGITESLINSLSSLSNLKVMSRGSVFRYKGQEQDPQKIGKDLNVRAVLTGSVKQIGDQLIINISLDDTENDQHIWGEQYVRKFADILTVQNDITQEVSTNLRLRLSGADEQKIGKRYTNNADAYQLYLKGQYEWNKHTEDALQKSIEYFDQAIQKDPNFALAYYGLSEAYGVLGNNYLRPKDAFPKARENASKALAIDDTLAEAHDAMGAVRLYYDWDWDEAEKEFKRAQALDQNDAIAHHLFGDRLEIAGRFDEELAERRRALELDPLSPMFNWVLGSAYYLKGDSDKAIEQLQQTINQEPRYAPTYLFLGQTYEQRKMYAEALKTYESGIIQAERNPQLIAALGHAYALAGDRDKANETLNELHKMSKTRYISPYLFAVVYLGLGYKDQTMAWLEKAYEDRSGMLIWLKVEPMFDSMHDDPRFQDLLKRIGLSS